MSVRLKNYLSAHQLSLIDLFACVAMNLLVWISAALVVSVPPGTSIRPMGWIAMVYILRFAPLVFIPFSVLAGFRERTVCLTVVTVLLSFAPGYLGPSLLRFAAEARGLGLGP
jgi:hypothetical protein